MSGSVFLQTRYSSANLGGVVTGEGIVEGSFRFRGANFWNQEDASGGAGGGDFKQTKACSKHVQTIGRTKFQLKTEEPYISEI